MWPHGDDCRNFGSSNLRLQLALDNRILCREIERRVANRRFSWLKFHLTSRVANLRTLIAQNHRALCAMRLLLDQTTTKKQVGKLVDALRLKLVTQLMPE